MKIAVIKIEVDVLQKLHDNGALHHNDYTAVEVFEKGFEEDPDYIKLKLLQKEAFADFKKKEREIEEQINRLRDAYNNQETASKK